MKWIADPTVGDWLRERLDEDLGVVPRGFAAAARVFHPAQVRSLPDRPMPSAEEWLRLGDAEQERLLARFADEQIRWADAAAAFGSEMHPLAQWRGIVRTPDDEDWHVRIGPDGREYSAPDEGAMPPERFAALARILTAHTATPHEGVVAVWEGWGELLGSFREPSAAITIGGSDAPPAHEQLLRRSIHDPFNTVFRKPAWQPGILSDEISKGPRLELPGRAHVPFSAGASTFADPAWILDAPWRDRPSEAAGFPPSAQHPALLWPEDRTWVMVSEIDFDSTVVTGSEALIAEICADPALEALPLPADADLSWDGDEVNR